MAKALGITKLPQFSKGLIHYILSSWNFSNGNSKTHIHQKEPQDWLKLCAFKTTESPVLMTSVRGYVGSFS